jgi:thiamine-phosphate pyrophosphorylase
MAFDLLAIATAEEMTDPAAPAALFEAGLSCLHLRSLTFDRQQFSDYISGIPAVFHSRIVIHTHYELIHTFDLKGIHFTEKTKANRPDILLNGNFDRCQLSASFHSLEELASNHFPYTYVLVSPVFDSISKEKYRSGFKPKVLSTFLSRHRKTGSCKVYALGGVGADNIQRCKILGFDGAALYGALWKTPNPVQAWKKILRLNQE